MKANLLAAAALVTGALALSACAEQRVIPAQAPPAPVPSYRPPAPSRPAPPIARTWADMPATPGDWRWSMEAGQSVARFGASRPVFTLRCDPSSRTIAMERAESSGSPAKAQALTIRTQTIARTLSAMVQPGTGTSLAASVSGRDPLLDAMAFSKGRFTVEVSGWPTLYVPAWTEVSRVVEDCR